MPREVVTAPGHDRRRSLGGLAWWWFETFCVHGPGDVQGDPVELDDELAEFILDTYALDGSGRRLYDSAFFSRAKGRAKSELAAFFVLFEAFGPCRFDRWAEGGETYTLRGETYVYEPGEAIGRPVRYPFIRCLATEEGQAGNTYDNVYFNLTDGPLGEDLPRDTAGLTRVLLPHGGEIVPSTASSASKDGGKESFAVFDETHLYTLPELRQMYRTVRRNLGKRREAAPWSLETSTMYAPGEDSVAEETHKLAVAVREGKTRRASRLLFDHREAPADVDLTDEAQVVEALREVYGPFADVMDLQRILDELYDPRNPVADSRRYFFNQRTSAEDAWLAHHEWAARLDLTRVIADGDMVTLGFDGSKGASRDTADSTALNAVRVGDGHMFTVGVWEQPPGPAGIGWEPPRLVVDATVRSAFDRWDVVGFFGDPSAWTEEMAQWQAAYGRKLRVKRTPNDPIRWKTNQHTAWAEALKSLHEAIVGGQMTHDGGSELTTHFLNARRRPTRSGLTIAKDHPDSPNKIDLAVAGTYAWAARLQAIAMGLGRERKRRRAVGF
jgi:hypothetical protein